MEILNWYAKKNPKTFNLSQDQAVWLPFIMEITSYQSFIYLLLCMKSKSFRDQILADKNYSKLVLRAMAISSISMLINIYTVIKTHKLRKMVRNEIKSEDTKAYTSNKMVIPCANRIAVAHKQEKYFL